MSTILGDRQRFATEVDDWDHELCRVDIWAAGQWLTCDDNMVFVRQFRRDVRDTAAWLRSGMASALPFDGLSPQATHRHLMLRAGADDETEADFEFRSRFRVMDWGPTTDNVTTHLFRDGDGSLITLQFRRDEHLLKHPEQAGQVFVAKIPTAELVGILEDLVDILDGRQSQNHP
ncbi:hypothetical protein [Streptomyces sp. NBC_01237]|uniref:hypothetical protein n=1 Tax=Streptomyces sp. NBC_01237 TaxID=2903790 RepID=UPI002DD7A04F|nr:hypothetical protein [Streptomyces sp. NBC_01237]WRZ76484.1 hypothetical protein OG251_35420 [Streptomyces sp. NBC_01237]